MTAAVAITPASGSITHLSTVCQATCSGVPNNTATGYDPTVYPSEPEVTYYFKLSRSGVDSLKGPVFSTNPSGIAEWDGIIFPSAGTWTLGAYKTSDDSSVATASVTVS